MSTEITRTWGGRAEHRKCAREIIARSEYAHLDGRPDGDGIKRVFRAGDAHLRAVEQPALFQALQPRDLGEISIWSRLGLGAISAHDVDECAERCHIAHDATQPLPRHHVLKPKHLWRSRRDLAECAAEMWLGDCLRSEQQRPVESVPRVEPRAAECRRHLQSPRADTIASLADCARHACGAQTARTCRTVSVSAPSGLT